MSDIAILQPTDRFPVEDWRYDVTNGDTRLGYLDWLEHNMESEANDA